MNSISQTTILVTCTFAMFSCGGTSGAQPHDMSAAQHEVTAANEEKAASNHAERYKATAQESKQTCTKGNTCWKSMENPTEAHKADAEKHQKMAADHRAAAKSLRDAEASACVGISDADRDMSPFNHREDISQVKQHVVEGRTGKSATSVTTGSDILFRAVPGMTAEWLQRVVDCHVARASSVGHNMPEMNYCPLELKHISAKVSSTGDGFAVAVTSDDSDTVKDIIRRADALVAHR